MLQPITPHSQARTRSNSLFVSDTIQTERTNGKKAASKKSATPTRDRERRELLELRAQVRELSDRLQVLSTTCNSSSRPRLTGRAAISRYIARAGRARRLQAESENRTLRLALERHSHIVSEFQSRIQTFQRTRRPAQQRDKPPTQRQSALDVMDRATLEQMVAQLDEAFAEVNGVLPPRGFSPLQSPSTFVGLADRRCYTLTRHDLIGGLGGQAAPLSATSPLIVLEDERVLPFDFELVVDAVWRAWVRWHIEGTCRLGGSWSDPSLHTDVDRPERTFAVKAWLRSSLSTLQHEPTFIKVKIAVRKYTASHPDRLVLVWRGVTEGEREFDGLYTEETTWVTVERGTECQEASDQYAVMRSYVRMAPRCCGGAFSVQDVQEFSKIVIQSYKDDVSMIYQEMESLLLLRSGSES